MPPVFMKSLRVSYFMRAAARLLYFASLAYLTNNTFIYSKESPFMHHLKCRPAVHPCTAASAMPSTG